MAVNENQFTVVKEYKISKLEIVEKDDILGDVIKDCRKNFLQKFDKDVCTIFNFEKCK